MLYVILLFVLPILILLSVRWLYPVIFALASGTYFADNLNRQYLEPSHKSVFIFHDVSAIFYLSSLFSFIGILALLVINFFYPFALFVTIIITLFKIFLFLYAIWFLTCFTAGAIFGREMVDGIIYTLEYKDVYFIAWDGYKNTLRLPEILLKDLRRLFDNEIRIQQRIDHHKSLIPNYKKNGSDYALGLLKDTIKLNQKNLKELKELRKKHGHLFFFWRNFNKYIYDLLFWPLMPIGMLYLMIAESFVVLFPSLNKKWDEKLDKEYEHFSK